MSPDRVVIRKSWRSEAVYIVLMVVLAVAAHKLSLLVPAISLKLDLFTLYERPIAFLLSPFWILPLAVLFKILIARYDVRYVMDEKGIESRIGIMSVTQRVNKVRYEDIRSVKRLSTRFSERVLFLLSNRELITDDVTSQILSQENTGFSVWLGEPFCDSESNRFVARYVERGPLSLEKLSVTDDIVSYATKDGLTHEFDALEFLALLSSHIPNTYESLTRYYGYYSCRARGERLKRLKCCSEKIQPIPEQVTPPSSTWAACIKRVYEINPLECPKCKSEMRIVAFVQDPIELKNIMLSLGLPNFRAPPPISIALPNLFGDSEHFD